MTVRASIALTTAPQVSGPIFRTGENEPGPQVLHIKFKRDFKRDDLGNRLHATQIIHDSTGSPGHPTTTDELRPASAARLSVPAAWLRKLKPGDEISFTYMRKRKRKREFVVDQGLSKTEVYITCEASMVRLRAVRNA